MQAEEKSCKLKNGNQLKTGHQRHSLNTEEMKPSVRGRKRTTDRTTRLLIVILVLFLIAEFPMVATFEVLISTPQRTFAGNHGHVVSYLGQAVLHRVLQPCGGDDGHDGPD